MYISNKASQTNTPVVFQVVSSQKALGKNEKEYESVNYTSWCNWTDYSGSDRDLNNINAHEENATLYFRWYDKNATAGGRVVRLNAIAVFDIVSVENIEQRDKAMIIRVKRVIGGV